MNYYNRIVIFLFLVIFYGCSETKVNPVNSNIKNESTLAKGVWNNSTLDWPTYSYYDDLYQTTFTKSQPNFYFSFAGYQYKLQYSRSYNNGTYSNSVQVYVNNTYCTTCTWTNTSGSNNSRWLGFSSFSYNGVSMQLNIYVLEHYIPMETWSEPREVQMRVYEYVAPDAPTGFSVTPAVHNNLNQAVTVTWNISNDTDVTGYYIYRKLQAQSWTFNSDYKL